MTPSLVLSCAFLLNTGHFGRVADNSVQLNPLFLRQLLAATKMVVFLYGIRFCWVWILVLPDAMPFTSVYR